MSAIGLTGSEPVSPGPEEGGFLLLVKPAEEFLESRIGLDFLDRVERVPEFVVGPRLVDEILAGVAGWRRVPSALAARDHVVPSRGHPSLTKCASFGHTTDPILLQKNIHSAIHSASIHLKVANPWLVSSTSSHPALSKTIIQE